MKKYFIVILIMLSLGVLSWAQGSKDLFDAKKSEAELDIMKGILGTTISHASQIQQKNPWPLNAYNISAYYLVGQGATFVIPTYTLRRTDLAPFLNASNIKLAIDLSKVKEQTQVLLLEAKKQAAEATSATQALNNTPGGGQGSGIGPGIGGGKGSGIAAPPAPPAPPALPAPPSPPQVDRQEVFQRMEEYQAASKKSREESAANQQKLLDSLKELHVPLIEALANYGDSLTQVKPGEYVNLILDTEDTLDIMDYGPAKTRHDVISAQKSWITDYKAGRISLENFKQKVLQYTE